MKPIVIDTKIEKSKLGYDRKYYLIECHQCKSQEWYDASNFHNRLFCSRECSTLSRSLLNPNKGKPRDTVGTCVICGKETHTVNSEPRITCSRECNVARRRQIVTENDSMFVFGVRRGTDPTSDPNRTKSGRNYKSATAHFICPQCGNRWINNHLRAPIKDYAEGFSSRRYPEMNDVERVCPHCLQIGE